MGATPTRSRIFIVLLALFAAALAPAGNRGLAFAQAPPQASPGQIPPFVGIAHVGLGVSDFDKARAFFSKLGYEQAFEVPGNGPAEAYVKINDRQWVELYLRSASQSGGTAPGAGSLQLCFETPDVKALRDAYVARGLTPSPINKGRAGNLLFSIHDPEGHLIEFLQYLPGSLHMQDAGKHLDPRRISDHLLRAVFIAHDLTAERDFYVDHLGFISAASSLEGKWALLRVPGSGDEVELRSADTGAASEIGFAVPDVSETRKELRRRGFAPKTHADVVSITGPDGNILAFETAPARLLPLQSSH